MPNFFNGPFDLFRTATFFMNKTLQAAPKIMEATVLQTKAVQNYWTGLFGYVNSFMAPSFGAINSFIATEKIKLMQESPADTIKDYSDLFAQNIRLAGDGLRGGMAAMSTFSCNKLSEGISAWVDTYRDGNGNDIARFAARQEELMSVAVHEYPKAIREVKPEYGFCFENGGYVKVAETERFEVYQVLPLNDEVQPRADGKPILIIPPYVLGANILAFLPGEQRSYVHCFAGQGIPTYVRILKDIDTTPAVQLMTGEDDALDTRFFCERLMLRHEGRKVTLNGFCQGGYHALAALLSGELDEVTDALITCATPIDGTRSKSLKEYLSSVPPRFRDLSYCMKTLPNGNQVVDDRIMGWVYKLRSMESESAISAFHRDLSLFDNQNGRKMKINKTASAVNHWITYDQKDLPAGITRMSFASYSTPVDKDGTLPVKLFGRKLNFKRLKEMGTPWLICIADKDDLVDKEASLAPLEHIDAEVCVFPKGHAAMATSWSIPTSECALHLRFCRPGSPLPLVGEKFRGPVCFHLDLEGEQAGIIKSAS